MYLSRASLIFEICLRVTSCGFDTLEILRASEHEAHPCHVSCELLAGTKADRTLQVVNGLQLKFSLECMMSYYLILIRSLARKCEPLVSCENHRKRMRKAKHNTEKMCLDVWSHRRNVYVLYLRRGGDIWGTEGLELKVAPAWRAPKSRGKNRSKCVPWLQRWRLPPRRKSKESCDADDDVSSFPHENSRNKNYDNHNFSPHASSAHECLCFVSRTKDPWKGRPWTIEWRLVFLPSGHCSIFIKSLHINQCAPICRRAEKGIKDLWLWSAGERARLNIV